MLAVIQRVSSSKVEVNDKTVGEIGPGLNILLGVVKGDTEEDIDKLLNKIIHLRIFRDDNGKMNRSLLDTGSSALVISQFTLAGNIKKGRRPSFDDSESPKIAQELYERFIIEIKKYVTDVQSGKFGAMMEVEIHNDGPVTFIINSKEL